MTPHPKLSRLTPPERVTAALMAVGGIRGLLAAVKTSRHNANSRRAYVGAFDALADAVAEAEREAFRRGQEVGRDTAIAAAMSAGEAMARRLGCTDPGEYATDTTNEIVNLIAVMPVFDAPPKAKEKT